MTDWTAADLPDQDGRTVVVTGANSGLGLAATRELARAGARVIMACRSPDRGERAREELRADLGEVDLAVRELDLGDLSSVRSFARGVDEPVDVLCNNAGVMAIPRSETADGFETQLGVNHLGHFALTGLLLDRLLAAEGARVVTHSSGLHERGRIDFEDLHGEDEYDPWDAYAASKLANLLFAYELDRRLRAADAPVTSVACHPGWAATNLQARGPRERGSRLRLLVTRLANALFAQSPADGALPMLYAAAAPGVEGGEYYGPGGFRQMRGPPERQRASDRARDEADARRLWERSVAATGVEFDLAPPVDA
jgi:NAD(P)-dependent dehydrogenase (short-subunit alcohol dehydrogenase family)